MARLTVVHGGNVVVYSVMVNVREGAVSMTVQAVG